MAETGQHTFTEIMSQPDIWTEALDIFSKQAKTLRTFWRSGGFERAIFTGCGSTHYLAIAAARLFQGLTGTPAQAFPASELVLLPESIFTTEKTLLVTVSRSGSTTETVEAVQVFRERGISGQVMTIGCYSESELAQTADFSLIVDSAREESVAQTRSFSTMLVLAQAMSATLADLDVALLNPLPGLCRRLLTDAHELARRLGEDAEIERLYFLGSHALYGVASEAMLKMKEMSLSYSESYHTLEFRHGPMSMVNNQTLMIGLLSDISYAPEMAVLQDMRRRGARGLALAENVTGAGDLVAIHLQSGLPQWARTVLYLPALQLLAYYRALSRGQNPDRPSGLEAVISLGKVR
ncbi:MAG: SIS domain-containing protein [Anaerolineae bacterium]|nr:SIS domain-containing protein [Anaerolineae bacterium]